MCFVWALDGYTRTIFNQHSSFNFEKNGNFVFFTCNIKQTEAIRHYLFEKVDLRVNSKLEKMNTILDEPEGD